MLSFANPTSDLDCPAPWLFDADAEACVAPASSSAECHSFIVPPTDPYRFVRGSAVGVQLGELCAFGPEGRTTDVNGA
jgi:hypothetical protein